MPTGSLKSTKALAYTQMIEGSPVVFVDGFIYEGFGAYLFQHVYDLFKVHGPVTLFIASDGGFLTEGTAFYDLVRAKGVELKVEIYGKAGSTATVIAAAAGKDNTSISEHSEYFLHHAYQVTYDPICDCYMQSDGNAEEMARVNALLVNIYVQLTGKTPEEIEALLTAGDEGKSLSALEAVDFGFCAKVIEPMPVNIAAFKAIAGKTDTIQMRTKSETMDKKKIKVNVKLTMAQALAAVATDKGAEVEVDADQATAEAIAAAEAKVKTAEDERDELKKQLDTMKEAAEESTKKVTDLEAEVVNSKKLMTEAKAAHDKEIAELKAPAAQRTVANNVSVTPGEGEGEKLTPSERGAKSFAKKNANPLAAGLNAKKEAK